MIGDRGLQFDVAVVSQRSNFPTIPRRRNLNQSRFGFQIFADMRVNLFPETLPIRGIMWNESCFALT